MECNSSSWMHLQGLPLLTDTLLGKYGECFAASYCKGKPVLVHFVAGMAGCTKEFQTLTQLRRGVREEGGCGGPCAHQQ